MSHDVKEPGGTPRRRYRAPQLLKVRLVPDEAVLASCKNQTTAGPAGPIGKCAITSACSHNAS